MKIVWGMLKSLGEYQRLAARVDEKLRTLTNGELSIETVLFDKDPADPLKEIERGELHLYQVNTVQLRHLLPEHSWLRVWEVPFVFKDEDHVEKYIASEHTKLRLASLETPALLPLTYSYAGGFCAVVTKRKEPNFSYENLHHIEFGEFDYETLTTEEFVEKIVSRLPSSILSYEINELLTLKPENKAFLNVETTRHRVVARISMISKNLLAQLPSQYREVFLKTLTEGLNEERHIIYERAQMNFAALRDDGLIGVNEGLNKEIQAARYVDRINVDLSATRVIFREQPSDAQRT